MTALFDRLICARRVPVVFHLLFLETVAAGW